MLHFPATKPICLPASTTETKCRECLAVWNAPLEEILRYEHHCAACKPRVAVKSEDTILLNWLGAMPNCRVYDAYQIWLKMESSIGSGFRGAIKLAKERNDSTWV